MTGQRPPVPSNIGRTLDWNVPSNRQIIIFTLAMILLFGILELANAASFPQAARVALGAGVACFLAWAIGREIEPDYPSSAAIAAFLTALGLLVVVDLPYLLPLGALLIGLRILSRSTGLPPRLMDYVPLVVITSLSIYIDNLPPLGVIISAVFASDALLPPPDRRNGLLFAGLMLVITAILGLVAGLPGATSTLQSIALIGVGMVSLLYLIAILWRPGPLAAVGDFTGEPLHRSRVLAAQVLALALALVAFVWLGNLGLIALLPLWAVLLSVPVRRVWDRIRA
jgi:hypothetical protein